MVARLSEALRCKGLQANLHLELQEKEDKLRKWSIVREESITYVAPNIPKVSHSIDSSVNSA